MKQQIKAAGFEIPTPVQVSAIPPALAGQDVFATAQTGTGKTLAFIIPALERMLAAPARHPRVLVLVPTRELAMQVKKQHDQLAPKKMSKAVLIMGGTSEKQQIAELRAGAQVIIATPGRFEDLYKRKLVQVDRIEMLVLDEADRMVDMGFITAIRRIVRSLPKKRQTLCFSATVEASVASLVEEMMKDHVRLSMDHTKRAAESVRLVAYEVQQSQKAALLDAVVRAEMGQSLVFVGTKRSSERVAARLEKAGHEVAVIHGDRSQSQRNRALDAFKSGEAKVLVATDVASRGIHVDSIAQVVNYDLPKMAEDFIHRVGRTGRAGATGVAATFFTAVERRDLASFERALNVKIERMAAPENLARETFGQIVDTSKLQAAAVVRGTRGGAVMLQGESLRKYDRAAN